VVNTTTEVSSGTTQELADLLNQAVARETTEDSRSWGQETIGFDWSVNDVWMRQGNRGGTIGFIKPGAAGSWDVMPHLLCGIEYDGATDDEMREEALERLDNELWPSFARRGYCVIPEEEYWDKNNKALLRLGEKNVATIDELIAEARFLANTVTSETFMTVRVD